MPQKIKVLIIIIVAFALTLLLYTFEVPAAADFRRVLFFMILSIVAESLLIITPENRALSVGFIINLTAILLFGVPEAAWIAGAGVMLRVVSCNRKRVHILNYPFYKTLFNGGSIIITTIIAGACLERFGVTPGNIELNSVLIPTMISLIVYTVVNATLVSALMSMLMNKPYLDIFFDNIMWVSRGYLTMAPVSILIALAYIEYGEIGVLIFFGPLLLARYSFKLYVDMKNIYLETVKSLSNAIEAKDPYTQGHSMRVSQYSVDLAAKLRLPQSKIENLKIAAILHDIGKIGVEESILNKKGRLSDEEYAKIKLHPEKGYKILKEIDFLRDAAGIILAHHERGDGTGYPMGIKGKEIPLEANILSVADVYDALTSDRPYRESMDSEMAFEILEKGKGTHFDERVVDALRELIILKEMKDFAG